MLPLRNVLRRKARSFFAVLQIAVAIAAFVSIVGVTQGLRAQFYRISQVFAFDLIVQARGAASPIFSSFTDEDADKALAVPGVAFCGTDEGKMFALDTSDGKTIWSMDAPDKTACGPSIVDGRVLWGYGFIMFGGPGPGGILALEVPV